jgi:two-component system KDP operon response regulator KdpE
MGKIYIIEDDDSLCRELAGVLSLDGHEPVTCEDFAKATQEALAMRPDAVVLDLKLPGADGLSICRGIRALSDVPILILTSSDAEFDEVMSMRLGADDYLTKPFSVAELLARLRVTLRRLGAAMPDSAPSVFRNGALRIDYAAGCVSLDGEEIRLTPIEYKLLCLLSRNVGKVLTHKYITQNIWGDSLESSTASLRVFMATLRKKLTRTPDSPAYIQTHVGIGYRMVRVEEKTE